MKYSLVILYIVLKILHADASENFTTHLSSHTLVAGEACHQSMIVPGRLDFEWIDYSCHPGEWLLQVGDEKDLPIIGKLEKSSIRSDAEFEYFKIIPTIPIDAEKRWVLRSHQLRVSLNGESQVVKVR